MTADQPLLDDLFDLSRELNRQAFAQPPVEGWLDSFLKLLCERFAAHSVKGIQVSRIVGNEALQVSSAGDVPEQARYSMEQTSPVSAALRTRQIVTSRGIRAYPIMVGENLVGVLTVYAGLTVEAIDHLLGALALQLGPALARDYRVPGPRTGRLTQQLGVMRSLYEVTRAASSALDANEVLTQAARSLVEMLPIDHVGVVLVDETRVTGSVVAEFPDNGIVGMKLPISEVFYGQLSAERRPIAVNHIEDAEKVGLEPGLFEAQGTQSVAFVPMIIQDELVGVVSLDVYFQYHEFTSEELDSAMTVTTQLAISIRNAELNTQVRRQASYLERLADFSRRITSTFDQQAIFKIAQEETQKLMAADVVAIGLRQPGQDVIQLVVLEGDRSTLAEFQVKQTALGFVCDSGMPDMVNDIGGSDLQDYKLLAQSGARAAMIAPLVVGGRTIGAYCVAHRQEDVYSSADLAVLEQIGNQLGVALENARLYHDAAQRAESEELMNRLSSTMQGRGNLQLTLLATVQEMAQALGARRARVRLQMPPAQTVDPAKMASLSRLADKLSEKREG